jgi:two-component system cell cycle sensor histidine kinase/response regulator CckA
MSATDFNASKPASSPRTSEQRRPGQTDGLEAAAGEGQNAAGNVSAFAKHPMSQAKTFRGRVLVVEDQALIGLDLERRLIRAGYDVVGIADNFDDAVELFKETLPDLVLMDIFIRGSIDGIETARAIGKISDVPVVFLTAYADDDTVRRAAETSPYGYLLKPFDERTLHATLAVALERYHADTRLRLLGAAVESATVGIVLVDARGDERKIVLCNDAFASMGQRSVAEIIGQRPCFLAKNGEEEGVLRLREALEQRTSADEVIRGQRANGEGFWSSVTISPVRSRSGQITHLLLFHMDITRQREAETALADSQRLELVGRLSAGIAHDMNNVLGAIVAFADLARRRLEQGDERMVHLDEVVNAAQRGALLTRKLLDFSRRETDAPMAVSDLSRVLTDARSMAERLAGSTVEVVTRFDPEPMFVSLDATSLEQIVLNLVVNARDAMPDGGKVTIAASRPIEASGALQAGRYVRLSVSDTGTGMEAQLIEKIFDPFFTTKPRGVGTGLGLYTCRMLVERTGGLISVQSELGRGTAFHLDFPLAESVMLDRSSADLVVPSAVGAPTIRGARIVGSAKGAKCLLVEDEPALRRACARALSDAGFEVLEAPNVETARQALDKDGNDIKLLITDMVLQGMSGSEVLSYAKDKAPDAATLVVTGYFDRDKEHFGPEVQILWKPFTAGTLARRALDTLQPAGKQTTVAKVETIAVDVVPAAPNVSATITLGGIGPTPVMSEEESKKPTVLLVEDDAALRKALGSVLESRNLRVLEAGTGAAAMAIIDSEELHLAVMDVNLPDTDGLELLSGLRARDTLLPTVVMTGDASIENAQRALSGRANAFLTKPIVTQTFVDECERALREGQVARLQHKLLMSKAGAGALLTDVGATEAQFEGALRGLFMAYQPIMRAYDHSVYAYEALMRCREPAMSPLEIIASAEALGRVDELGRRVRTLVAKAVMEHHERHVQFFVNLHPMEMRTDLLLRSDEPLIPVASRVVLEVTERAQLAAAGNLALTLQSLRHAGFRVALDDLGEGYAGLSWLVKLTPDIAKLDMSLIRDIHHSRMKRELVASLVGVCRRAKTMVVAEGVESEAEAALLMDLGCELLQGYYFGKPGPLPRP